MKKALIIMVITVLLLAIIGGYLILDRMFPIADPIDLPAKETITSITLTDNNGNTLMVETSTIDEILKSITDVKPTRIMSVNDSPAVKNFYSIEIRTDTRQYRYYLYAENLQVYIEDPYTGVYQSEQQFLDYIATYFQS